MNKFQVAVLVAAGALSVVATGMASAQNADVPKIVLRYDAASLQTDAGVRHLYARLEHAAEQVCPNDGFSPFASSIVAECRRHAVADAVEQIHNTRLAALSSSREKRG